MIKISDFKISEKSTLLEAVKKMELNQRGFISIENQKDKKIIGILTDPDIRRLIVRTVDFSKSVSLFCNRKFTHWNDKANAKAGYAFLNRSGFRQLPVLNDKKQLVNVLFVDDLNTHRNSNLVLIMAGGKGIRLHPLTKNCPKPMIKVNGKPILEKIIENLIDQGFYRFVISVNYLKEQIESHFKNGSKWGVEISYLKEKTALGTAGAIRLLKNYEIEKDFLIVNGDVLTTVNYSNLLNYHSSKQSFATMCVRNYETHIPFGLVEQIDGEFIGIKEKPVIKNFINAGIYCAQPSICELIPKEKKIDMTDVFEMAKVKSLKTLVFPVHENWIDIGTKKNLMKANQINK